MTIALLIIGVALFCGWSAIADEKEHRGLGFVIGAAIGAGTAGGIAWLVTAGLSWLSQNPWGWLLFFGLFIAGLFVYAVVGALCLIVDLLSGR